MSVSRDVGIGLAPAHEVPKRRAIAEQRLDDLLEDLLSRHESARAAIQRAQEHVERGVQLLKRALECGAQIAQAKIARSIH